MDDSPEHTLCCEICNSKQFTEPVVTDCKHKFCWACLYAWSFHRAASLHPWPAPVPECPVCKKTPVSVMRMTGLPSEPRDEFIGNIKIPPCPSSWTDQSWKSTLESNGNIDKASVGQISADVTSGGVLCTICLGDDHSQLVEPCLTGCGHVYCWPCIFQSVQSMGTDECPQCRKTIVSIIPDPSNEGRKRNVGEFPDVPTRPSPDKDPFEGLRNMPLLRGEGNSNTPAEGRQSLRPRRRQRTNPRFSEDLFLLDMPNRSNSESFRRLEVNRINQNDVEMIDQNVEEALPDLPHTNMLTSQNSDSEGTFADLFRDTSRAMQSDIRPTRPRMTGLNRARKTEVWQTQSGINGLNKTRRVEVPPTRASPSVAAVLQAGPSTSGISRVIPSRPGSSAGLDTSTVSYPEFLTNENSSTAQSVAKPTATVTTSSKRLIARQRFSPPLVPSTASNSTTRSKRSGTTPSAETGSSRSAASGSNPLIALASSRSAATGTSHSAATGITTSAETGTRRSAVPGSSRSAVPGSSNSAVTGSSQLAAIGSSPFVALGSSRSAVTGSSRLAATGTTSSTATSITPSAATGITRSAVTGSRRSAVPGSIRSAVPGSSPLAALGSRRSAVTGSTSSETFRSTSSEAFRSTSSEAFRSTSSETIRPTPSQALRSNPSQALRSTPSQALSSTPSQATRSTNSQATRSTSTATISSITSASIRPTPSIRIGSAPSTTPHSRAPSPPFEFVDSDGSEGNPISQDPAIRSPRIEQSRYSDNDEIESLSEVGSDDGGITFSPERIPLNQGQPNFQHITTPFSTSLVPGSNLTYIECVSEILLERLREHPVPNKRINTSEVADLLRAQHEAAFGQKTAREAAQLVRRIINSAVKSVNNDKSILAKRCKAGQARQARMGEVWNEVIELTTNAPPAARRNYRNTRTVPRRTLAGPGVGQIAQNNGDVEVGVNQQRRNPLGAQMRQESIHEYSRRRRNDAQNNAAGLNRPGGERQVEVAGLDRSGGESQDEQISPDVEDSQNRDTNENRRAADDIHLRQSSLGMTIQRRTTANTRVSREINNLNNSLVEISRTRRTMDPSSMLENFDRRAQNREHFRLMQLKLEQEERRRLEDLEQRRLEEEQRRRREEEERWRREEDDKRRREEAERKWREEERRWKLEERKRKEEEKEEKMRDHRLHLLSLAALNRGQVQELSDNLNSREIRLFKSSNENSDQNGEDIESSPEYPINVVLNTLVQLDRDIARYLNDSEGSAFGITIQQKNGEKFIITNVGQIKSESYYVNIKNKNGRKFYILAEKE